MEPVITEYTFFIDKPLYRIESDEDGSSGICLLTNSFSVELRDRKNDLWVVVFSGSVLNSDGLLEFEPSPSNREDDFLSRTRFSRDEALDRAKKFIALHKEYRQDEAVEELRKVREANGRN